MQHLLSSFQKLVFVSFGFLLFSFFINVQAESSYGQDFVVRSKSVGQSITGEVFISGTTPNIDSLEYILAHPETNVVLWQQEKKPFFAEKEEGLLLHEFSFELNDVNAQGSYSLYIAGFDSFKNRIGVGEVRVDLSSGEESSSISNILYSEKNGRATLSADFVSKQKDKKVSLAVDGYLLNEETPVFSEKGSLETITEGVSQNISVTFNLPQNPGAYEFRFYGQDEDGQAYSGMYQKKYTVKGEFAILYGAIPDRDLEDVTEFVVDIQGALPEGAVYDLALELEQKNEAGTVSATKDVLSIEAGKDLRFQANNLFLINEQAKTLHLQASVINPETQETIGKKVYDWSTNPSVIIPVKESIIVDERVSSKNNPMQIYVLISLLFIMGLLLYLFLSGKKQRLNALVLGFLFVGTTVSAADVSGAYRSSEFIFAPSVSSYTTDAKGLSVLSVDGAVIHSLNNTSAFIDKQLTSIKLTLVEKKGAVKHNIGTVSRSDVFFGKKYPSDPDLSQYIVPLNVKGKSLPDGIYGVALQFNFNGGDVIKAERNNFLRIDSTDPSLSVSIPAGTKALNTSQSFTIRCTDDSPCLDQPDIGGGKSDRNKQFVAKIKGNFCEGSGSGKLCKKNTNTRRFNEFEVCDGAGNCSETQTIGADLFYYDPFPPQMTEIELIRVDGIGKNARSFDVVRDSATGRVKKITSESSQAGINGIEPDNRWKYTNTNTTGTSGLSVAAHAQFAFDLVDDNDTQTDVGGGLGVSLKEGSITELFTISTTNTAGPAADASACGEFAYDFGTKTTDKARRYGSDNRKSDFFFGVSVEEKSISRCRQRKVACSNAPGHAGFWDRSLKAGTTMKPWECTVDGVPKTESYCTANPEFCCGEGYDYNAGANACVTTKACDPTAAGQINTDANAWMYKGNPTDQSQTLTFRTSNTPTTNTCSWGCDTGWVRDGDKYACTPDCTDGLFPICLGVEQFGS